VSNHQTITTVQRGTGPPMLDIDRAERIATAFFKGGITGGATTRDGVLARIIAGHYLGLNETASVIGVMVNGGKPAVWGDVLLAKIRASGELADYREEISGEGDALTATVTVTRVGHEHSPTVRSFSVADAKKAGLWTKAGPWQQYTRRMLPTKPRAWALRDTFADVLMGISIREEYEPPEGVPVAVALAAMKALPQLVTPTPALPAATVATPADPEGPITSATLGQVAYARTEWLKATEIDPADGIAVAREWGGLLAEFGVKSAKEMTEAGGQNLLAVLRKRTTEAGEFDPAKIDAQAKADMFGGDPEQTPAPVTVAAEVVT
jgi:hypothetical protein